MYSTKELCEALALLETPEEFYSFLRDLCTPVELTAMAERWQICKLLHNGMSYREIHNEIGASMTTIGRVARFLKDEPYGGYDMLLDRIAKVSDE